MTALTDLTDCVVVYADENMLLGQGNGGSLTTGTNNTALGDDALTAITEGSDNVAIGASALSAITTQSGNTAVGSGALSALAINSVSIANVALGQQAMGSATSGNHNTCVGADTSLPNGTVHNTLIGYGASGSASHMVAIGANASVGGDDSIAIGYGATVSSAVSNSIAIGYQATATSDDTVQIGNSSTLAVYFGSGGITLGTDLSLGGNPRAGTPPSSDSSTRIATTAFVQTVVGAITAGLDARPSCRVATTAALTATYSNGSSGVGATLTNSGTQAAISIDGVALAANDRVLVKNQATAAQNGIYTVTTVGSGSTNWVLTRATDFNTASGTGVVEGAFTVIEEGTSNFGTLWIETGAGPFTIGTTAITFTQLQVTNVTDAGILFSDITTNNSSTSKHGFLKKLDNTATHYMDGTGNWSTPAGTLPAVPTFQYLTSGTSATYTTPANCRAILVKAVGGGGGGGAETTNNGSAGGDTIFNSIHAKGGSGGLIPATQVAGGAGGTGGTGSASLRIAGGDGGTGINSAGASNAGGGHGGSSVFGGGGRVGSGNGGTGQAGKANSGGGGGGAGPDTTHAGPSGGGAGEYIEIYIASPASTYTYTVGAGGNGGAAGNFAGGAGGSGLIIVTEYY